MRLLSDTLHFGERRECQPWWWGGHRTWTNGRGAGECRPCSDPLRWYRRGWSQQIENTCWENGRNEGEGPQNKCSVSLLSQTDSGRCFKRNSKFTCFRWKWGAYGRAYQLDPTSLNWRCCWCFCGETWMDSCPGILERRWMTRSSYGIDWNVQSAARIKN